ncbi:MAG: nuclear transport factor 2 family protein [Deltaproteobacteria bacterium]|nr:nuclear transport factor 2 family protein [Deltaproteobacteria bacterium]
MWSPERNLLEANLAFYEALTARDLEGMARLWSDAERVSCVHAGWQVLHGRRQVMASWRALLSDAAHPLLRCEDARAVVIDQVGLVTCAEKLPDGARAATNLFALERGIWKLVHRHVGLVSRDTLPPESAPPRDALN